MGYTHLDCASDYDNETEVGAGLAAAAEEFDVRREDVWITSKVCHLAGCPLGACPVPRATHTPPHHSIDCHMWEGVGCRWRCALCTRAAPHPTLPSSQLWNTNHRPEHVRAACETTLSDLGISYLDLYLIHFPISVKHIDGDATTRTGTPRDAAGNVEFDPVPLADTWRAMEALVDAGLVRNIGVANFSSQLLLDLLSYARCGGCGMCRGLMGGGGHDGGGDV
jgi:aryl-alcohol dehydrogenase-like predicted oxidoreductase